MRIITLGVIALTIGLCSCGEPEEKGMSAEETKKVQADIEQAEMEAKQMEDAKNSIEESAKELDEALNNL